MNWTEIENTISENRHLFDDAEPSANHTQRFEDKLQKRFAGTKTNDRKLYLKIAAAVAFLVISSSVMMYSYFHIKSTMNKPAIITQTAIEFQETEDYFAQQINAGLEQLKKMELSDSQQQKTILAELADMDKNYEQLKNELKMNPDDERLIHAIIEHYQVKLGAINQILNSVSYSHTNEKHKSHEQNI